MSIPGLSKRRAAMLMVPAYAFVVVGLWLAVAWLSDRVWPATLIAFGPRWLAALPLVPLAVVVASLGPSRLTRRLLGVLTLAGCLVVLGLLDFRLGLQRGSGQPVLRLMIHNLGGSQVTAAGLDRLLRTERVDVAALQECPFYDNSPALYGWRFYYGGDLCIASRFPFSVMDEADPDSVWRRGDRKPLRVTIQEPAGPFELLNVHFETIRGGLAALGTKGWSALPQFARNRSEARLDSQAAHERISHVSGPLLVVGDFNLPVESAIYRANWAGFENVFSSCGRGFGHTKFTSLFGIRIDHVLASAQWQCVGARVLSSPYGGDHAPLVVDLQLR